MRCGAVPDPYTEPHIVRNTKKGMPAHPFFCRPSLEVVVLLVAVGAVIAVVAVLLVLLIIVAVVYLVFLILVFAVLIVLVIIVFRHCFIPPD